MGDTTVTEYEDDSTVIITIDDDPTVVPVAEPVQTIISPDCSGGNPFDGGFPNSFYGELERIDGGGVIG